MRLRCSWNKFREFASFVTSKVPSLNMKGQVYIVMACISSCCLRRGPDGDVDQKDCGVS